MEKTSENIRQLLDMLDNPEAYTEQEIQDIINQDEYTRETYRFMVEAKRSSRQHLSNKPVDVDTAWQKFNQKVQSSQHHFSWIKIATILTFGRVFPRSEEQMQASLFSLSRILYRNIACIWYYLCSHSNCKKHSSAYVQNGKGHQYSKASKNNSCHYADHRHHRNTATHHLRQHPT